MDKLDAVVLRLEAAVKRLEIQNGKGDGDENRLLNCSLLIAKMEDILYASGAEVQVVEIGKHLPDDTLKQVSMCIEESMQMMLLVMQGSILIAQPTPEQMIEMNTLMAKRQNESINRLDKAFKYTQLEKSLLQVVKCFLWMFNNGGLEFFKGQQESADFFYLKVKLLKDPAVDHWYSLVQQLLNLLKEYVHDHFQAPLQWNKTPETNYSYEQLLQDLSSPELETTFLEDKREEEKKEKKEKREEEKKEKKDKREEDKKDRKEKKEEEEKEKKEKKEVEKKEKKESKTFLNQRWFVNNYKDCDVTFLDEEYKSSNSVFLRDCHNVRLVLNNKLNNITLDNCTNTKVQCTYLIGSIELIQCDKAQIVVQNHAPLINLDKSRNVEIFLEKDQTTQVITSESSTITVSYKSEEGTFDEAQQICTQQSSKLNTVTGKLETTNYELFN